MKNQAETSPDEGSPDPLVTSFDKRGTSPQVSENQTLPTVELEIEKRISSYHETKREQVCTKWNIKWFLWANMAIAALNQIDSITYLILLPNIQDDFGFSDGYFGTLLIIKRAMNLFWAPLLMHLGTFRKPYQTIAITAGLVVIGNITISFSTEYWHLILCMTLRTATSTQYSYTSVIVDMYAAPESRIWWTQLGLAIQGIAAFIGLGLAVVLDWRWCYRIQSMVMVTMVSLCWYIDGPSVLPRTDETAQVDPKKFFTHIWATITVPRILLTIVLVDFWFAIIQVQVEFASKFTEEEFGWSDGKTVLMTGLPVIILGSLGKLVGACVIERKKNQSEIADSRSKLHTFVSAMSIPPAVLMGIVQMTLWFLGPIGFIANISLEIMLTGYHPEYNFLMWSGPSDLVPYILPTASYGYVVTNMIMVGMVSGLLELEVNYPMTYSIAGMVTWFVVASFAILAYTDWIPQNYEYIITPPELCFFNHVELESVKTSKKTSNRTMIDTPSLVSDHATE